MFKVLSGNVLREITENEAGRKTLINVFILLVFKLTHFFFLNAHGKKLTNNSNCANDA